MESWLRHEEEVKTGNKVNMRNRPWNDDGGQRVVRGMKQTGWSRWSRQQSWLPTNYASGWRRCEWCSERVDRPAIWVSRRSSSIVYCRAVTRQAETVHQAMEIKSTDVSRPTLDSHDQA